MLWFTSGLAPAPLRRTRRDVSSWLEAAQAVAQSIDAPAALGTIDVARAVANLDAPGAVRDAGEGIRDAGEGIREGLREGVADASRQLRATAADIGDDLRTRDADNLRKSVLMLLPSERRRRSRRRAVLLALAGLAVASVAGLLVTRLARRRSSGVPRLASDWTPSGESSTSDVAADRMARRTAVMDPASSTAAPVGGGAGAQAERTVAPRSAASASARAAEPAAAIGGTHPPVGLTPDATTVPTTFDRDAGIRAAGEGMEPPEGDLAGPAPAKGPDRSHVADGQ